MANFARGATSLFAFVLYKSELYWDYQIRSFLVALALGRLRRLGSFLFTTSRTPLGDPCKVSDIEHVDPFLCHTLEVLFLETYDIHRNTHIYSQGASTKLTQVQLTARERSIYKSKPPLDQTYWPGDYGDIPWYSSNGDRFGYKYNQGYTKHSNYSHWPCSVLPNKSCRSEWERGLTFLRGTSNSNKSDNRC